MMKTIITKDLRNKRLNILREFDAPLELVWKAWTDSSILDQWWAPKPWKAATKVMDFKEGGHWVYCMNGPEGEQHWARADYEKIVPQENFSGMDSFCDEKGNLNHDLPRMQWQVKFSGTGSTTRVEVEVTFASVEDLEKIVEMGFQEGFAAAHENLDELLKELVSI
jgi:uncharacterized protein YndB with AHSA1/START domain